MPALKVPYGAQPLRRESSPFVFVVHDDFSVRQSVEMLSAQACWRVQSFADAASLLAQLDSSGPACLILGTHLPDIDGLELQSLLARQHDISVIFVADNPSVRTTVRAMKAGAVDFLTTPLDEYLLRSAIEQAVQRSSAVQTREAERRALQQKYQQLSRREREVMQLVIGGSLNKHVAERLGISEITVKVHRGRMMRKMQARSVPELVNMAATLGVVAERASRGQRPALAANSLNVSPCF